MGELDAVPAPWFARAGTRLAAQQYVRGLASTVERKNSWQLAEHGRTPHPGPVPATAEVRLRGTNLHCFATGQRCDPQQGPWPAFTLGELASAVEALVPARINTA